MNSVTYDVTRLPSVLTVGRQTETGVMAVRIDCTGWLTFWPNLTLRLFVTAPNGVAAYPAKTHMDGKVLVWDVSGADTMTAGKGSLEVVGEAPGKRKLSAVTEINVLRTTTATTGEPPEQIKTWFEEVKEAADTATAAMAGVATATANANAAADRANSVAADMDAATPAIVQSVSGNVITVSDSADRKLRKVMLYGKTTQNGTPTPDAPVALVSLAENGKVGVVTADKTPTITITGQPAAPIGTQGDTFTFKVQAEGEYLSYQWVYSTNGGAGWVNSTQSGNNTSTMTMTARPYHNGYPYYCEITDAYGNTVRTNTVVATVGDTTPAIQLILNPADVTAPVGGIAVFRTEAIGTGLTYQWQWQEINGSNWSDSSQTGNKTPVFSMPVESHRNGYKYRCVITDANGNTVTTDMATLTVGDVVKPVTFRTIVNAPNGLNGVPVTSGGNYTDKNGQQWVGDSIAYDADVGTAKLKQLTVRLAGETAFNTPYKNSTEVMWRVSPVSAVKPNVGYPAGVCSKYIIARSYDDVQKKNGYIGINVNGELLIRDDSLTDAAAVTAMLTSGDFELVYPLAEPVETELSADQFAVLRNFYPTTVMYNSERAHMAVSYVADTKLYINGLMGVIENGTY